MSFTPLTPQEPTLKLLLVDDHTLFLEGLKAMLQDHKEISVVGLATDGDEAVRLAEKEQPEVVLLDLKMPGDSGFEVLEKIHEVSPESHIVVLTNSTDNRDVWKAIKMGARGYLTKDTPMDKLMATVLMVHEQGTTIEPILADRILMDFEREDVAETDGDKLMRLSKRELEILNFITQGQPNKTIASTLQISQHTVRNHISNIFRKLRVNNRTEATVIALTEQKDL